MEFIGWIDETAAFIIGIRLTLIDRMEYFHIDDTDTRRNASILEKGIWK